jgi:putative membrane protein
MALFIDSLAIMLIGLGSGTFLVALYFLYSALGKAEWIREQLVIPTIGVGLFDFISGYEMSFTWPLPSGYNMLFGDPLLFLGILLVAGAIMVYKKMNPASLSFLSVILGIYVLVGAYSIVTYKLETGNDLISSMGLYVVDGIAALLAPILIMKPNGAGKALYYLEFVLLLLGTLAALFIGYNALPEHLVDFSKYFPSVISMLL